LSTVEDILINFHKYTQMPVQINGVFPNIDWPKENIPEAHNSYLPFKYLESTHSAVSG